MLPKLGNAPLVPPATDPMPTVFITPRSIQRSYSDTLPSLNLRYEARPDVLLRAAAYARAPRAPVGAAPDGLRLPR
jgi:hypothetical protein